MLSGAGLHVLLVLLGVGILHAGLRLRRRPVSVLVILVAGAGLSLAVGFVATAPVLSGQARTSLPTAVLWTVLLALGFAATGIVLSGAWLLGFQGLAAWLRRPPKEGNRG